MQNHKKHIVLITTWFTPQIGVAVNRMAAFANYFDKTKFDFTVITLQANGIKKSDEKQNDLRIIKLPNKAFLKRKNTKVGESKFTHYSKVIWNVLLNKLVKFEYNNWLKAVDWQLENLHREKKIDVIISSYSPVEPHLAAINFCKKNEAVIWVADCRDEMSLNPFNTKKQKSIYSKIEAQINAHASIVSSVSEPIVNDFKTLMPQVNSFLEVRNGFDHDYNFDYNFNEIFTITYAGTFYGLRKPHTFFNALEQFVRKTKAQIELNFVGTHNNFFIPELFKNSCRFYEKVNQNEALKIIAEADANLLVLPTIGTQGVYSGKIFDYISVYKPIIAVVDKSDVAAKLINELNAGFVADFDSINEIEKCIQSAYELWQKKEKLNSNRVEVLKLHRKFQVKKLEEKIEQFIK